VKNYAVATNPVDWKVQQTGLIITEWPTVLGSDVSGTVEAVGEGVTHFKPGDRVTGFAAVLNNQDLDHGAFQEYTLLKEKCAAKIPASMSFEEGAILPMAVATAGMGIWLSMGLPRPGTKQDKESGGFLVWGAASSVGSAAVQMAALLGYTVYATASSQHHSYIKTLGATHVFDYKEADVVDKITSTAKTAGQEIKYAYDAISEHGTAPKCATVLDAFGGGRLLLVLPWPQDAQQPSSVKVDGCLAHKVASDYQDFSGWLFNDWLEKALVEGSFVPSPKIQIVKGGIPAVQEALDKHRKGLTGQKLVIPLRS